MFGIAGTYLDQMRTAQLTRSYNIVHLFMVVVKTTHKAYLQFYPSFFGRCNGLPNLLQIGMDGLLTNTCLPASAAR